MSTGPADDAAAHAAAAGLFSVRCARVGKRIGAGGRNVPIASDAVMRRFRSDP
ncbi:hypothetical protein BPC006_I1195 [Burkholderia pseudomallei BPC006]|nr:hypothetical protein BPC006_I1195 [Burkholderia pseudomallei BPC006]EEC36736.1 conserved hypothetical protein [Burkholderia pseudomallei 576]EEH29498.1 conserved hypothetical protein [Burkholderia pseudomallei Pakistan 9]